VDDEMLRDRLKEAKGIGTPATRAEIIGGLKKQEFLVAQGKSIVPTESGLRLFGVLKEADPALVDPGQTAQLECLLDDVVVGKQQMVAAVDAVCDVARRIIGKLIEGPVTGGPLLPGSGGENGGGERPPTPAMKRYAESLARQRRIALPAAYATSGAACRAFLQQHAPQKPAGDPDAAGATPASADEAGPPVKKRRRRTGGPLAGKTAPSRRKARKSRPAGRPADASPALARHDAGASTPLSIPYGNKEVALKLGARYGAGGWHAPPGVDLAPFKARGWL
jgi:DNA topoisomerase-3